MTSVAQRSRLTRLLPVLEQVEDFRVRYRHLWYEP